MSNPKGCYVGFDTSNYTTSVAACDEDGKIIANLKAPLLVKAGELGLRQSDAVFSHIKNLPEVCERLSKSIEGYTPLAVAASATPRTQENSYMPCFLCGVAAANAFAASCGIKVYKNSHQNGHIMAALYSSGATKELMQGQFIAFHLSGGTTEALLVTPTENDFKVEIVGGTKDISAGQAIDRVGVMMGVPFPAGKEMEILTAEYIRKNGPLTGNEIKKLSVQSGFCNLSGIENHAKKIFSDTCDKEKTAAFVFDFICRTVKKMTEQLLDKYGELPVLFSGGVMSNKLMRDELSGGCRAYFAEPEFSSDNGAGIALLCRLAMKK